ncbi:hypothetical protein CTEN210_18336 [Chaetoceros tenuissimus]|uniref:HRDC domain-containing protein n=1 Tax=Chaetoceros tenuissimus TaxID=426638 RepID=A0AAD3DEE7_9STRA|nr:hypothetical protein CTEN210_18336 [Chaetoceros tenuissimus]
MHSFFMGDECNSNRFRNRYHSVRKIYERVQTIQTVETMSIEWDSPKWKTADPPVSPRKGRRTYDISQVVSPNRRATCVRCNHKIEKGQQRVGIQCKRDTGRGFEKWQPRYYHADCITESCKRKLVFKIEKPRKKLKVDTDANTTASGDRKSLLTAKKRKQLRQDLRFMRSLLAKEHYIPSKEEYKIFPNQSLDQIVDRLPTNLDDLKECKGIKEKRATYYGEEILQIVRKYLDQTTLDNPQANPTQKEEQSSDDEVEFVKELSVQDIVSKRVKELKASGQFEEIDL